MAEVNPRNVPPVLWGVYLGDALGAPHEFPTKGGVPLEQYCGRLVHRYLRPRNRFTSVVKWGVIGQVTDDSEMTIALLQSILTCRKTYNREAAINWYRLFANSGAGMGKNTRALLAKAKDNETFERRWRELYGPGVVRETPPQSNGCLMRAAPLAFVGNYAEAVVEDCNLTNPDPLCLVSCSVYVKCIRQLICQPAEAAQNLSLEQLKAQTSEHLAELEETHDLGAIQTVREALGHAFDVGAGDRDVTGLLRGWVLHGLWCAFRALAMAVGSRSDREDFQESPLSFSACIDYIIRLGGDTDTNGAIAGGLLGAYYGMSMLGEEITKRNIDIILAADTTRGEVPRPDTLHPSAGINAAMRLFE